MNQAIKDYRSGPGDAKRGKIEQGPALPFVSETTYDSNKNEKGKYIELICRYNPTKQYTKKNNCNVYMKIFDHSTPEDILLWYSKILDIFLKKSCYDAESKFNITEILLAGQAEKNFLRFETEICEAEVTTEGATIATKHWIIESIFKEILERLRDFQNI